jgi:hypothetical protein
MPEDKGGDLGRVEDATRQVAVNLANLEHGILSPFQTQLLLSGDLNKDLSNYQSASGRGVEYLSKDVDRQILSLWASLDVLIAEINRLREQLKAVKKPKRKPSPKPAPSVARPSARASSRKYNGRGGQAQTKR